MKDYGSATLRCEIRALPFLELRPHAHHPGAIQGKEGIKLCHLATLVNEEEEAGGPREGGSRNCKHCRGGGGGWETRGGCGAAVELQADPWRPGGLSPKGEFEWLEAKTSHVWIPALDPVRFLNYLPT